MGWSSAGKIPKTGAWCSSITCREEIARRMMEGRRRLEEAVSSLTDEEARAFLKGLKLLVDSFDTMEKEKPVGPHR